MPCCAVLRKEEYEAFFDRLMADTARRAQHRCAGRCRSHHMRVRKRQQVHMHSLSFPGGVLTLPVPPTLGSRCRDELAEKAREEALAKLKRSAPPPLNHQRPASPSQAH